MNALVIGGTRFIGRRLVEELLAAGHQVTLYNRGRTPDGFGTRVRRLTGDRRSAADLSAAFARLEFDAAYDFLSYDASDARLAIQTLRGRVGRFVHISTCSVYWCTGDFPCPVPEEDFDRLGDFAERPGSIEYEYGYGKRKAEEALFAARQDGGFPVTTVRLPIVGGAADPSQRYASYFRRVADGGPVLLPDGGYAPFRHAGVSDVARALAALPRAAHAEGQAYNLAGAEILSVRSIVTAIASLMGRGLDIVEIPTPVLRAMGLGTAFSPFTQQAPQVPAIFKARRDLSWSPQPHQVWLEESLRWWLERGSAGGGEDPPQYRYRGQERETIERYRAAVISSAGRDATSGGPPG